MPSTPGSPAPLLTDAENLDAELKRLHGTGAAEALSHLHQEAAALASNLSERRFHLTHAWVYALVHGDTAQITPLETALHDCGGL